MDTETLNKALKKSDQMLHLVAAPDFVQDDQQLLEYHDGVSCGVLKRGYTCQ